MSLLSGDCQNGQGSCTFPNGAIYEGAWKDGKPYGEGTYSLSCGGVYKGMFKEGKEWGRGTLTTTNGDVYKGQWRDGKKHGEGIMTWANGTVYKGTFRSGKKNGHGSLTTAAGDVYKGSWNAGKRNGKGKWTAAVDVANPVQCDHPITTGSMYAGGWAADKRHGVGLLTDGGVMHTVRYEHGKLLSEDRAYPVSDTVMPALQQQHSGTLQTGRRRMSSGPGEPPHVFLSLRFAEAKQEAEAVQEALEVSKPPVLRLTLIEKSHARPSNLPNVIPILTNIFPLLHKVFPHPVLSMCFHHGIGPGSVSPSRISILQWCESAQANHLFCNFCPVILLQHPIQCAWERSHCTANTYYPPRCCFAVPPP